MRKLGPVEAALVVAIGASVLAVTIPVFLRNLRASRFVEPLQGLQHLATQAAALAITRTADGDFPGTVDLTPAQVPQGRAVVDPPGSWDHPTWRGLAFEQKEPHYYSFAFQSRVRGAQVEFTALAHGDLDGDGDRSTFSQLGEASAGGDSKIEPLYMHREVE